MPTRFDLPHIDIAAFRSSSPYAGSGSPNGGSAVRIRGEHGRRLQNELNVAFAAADAAMPSDDRLEPPEGTFLEVELRRGTKADILERKTDGVRPGAVKPDDQRTVALYVPDHARGALERILEDYTNGPLSVVAGQPPMKSFVEPIEAFRRARLETFWTDDPEALPKNPRDQIWWALWCWKNSEAKIEEVCERLGVRAANRDRRLYFPEAVVIPVLATRADIELMLFATGAIAELRRASDSPVFFTDEVRDNQHEWTEDLATRVIWPPSTAPSVCLLDTGVNRAHMLIEPALANADMHVIDRDWGTDDHDGMGHGTAMAGLALHGDLTAQLGDQSERVLQHRLESVKILPPDGFEANDPHSYGVLTQTAISLPEITAPERARVFCMAVTNKDVSGSMATTWSAAVDQAAAGTMIGDDASSPRRLFVVSTGNIAPEIEFRRIRSQDFYPVEDPAQAWNALTVGGYTDLIDVNDAGYEDWQPFCAAGQLSPYSRTSVAWPQGRAPFKPEIVLEAGNRAVSPSGTEVLTVDSLSLLSTGRDVDKQPLVPFQATSAATAQAGRLAAQLSAAHLDYWPETIRALIIHSAEWTQPMLAAFATAAGKKNNYELVRRFGYGVPSLERAAASSRNHLALISQSPIQPFRLQGGRKFNECHYYDLPLPRRTLEELGNEPVEMKVTLSYFIDPNPGLSANVDPQRYQSHGLRFDLRRKNESISNFQKRVNASEREDPRVAPRAEPDDNRWLLGPQSISAGSLHCDVWSGPAIELLGRDKLCIKPVNGWWRTRASAEYCNKATRYALIITMKTRNVDIDLYTPIAASVDIRTAVPIEV
ncbi:peptidase S8 family protein [Bosea vaviloviae]|uniref:Peptidase S8 family protein n=2 Tax=Bosea vaviloviae TaxID=1526658 RepID=A0A1D7U7W1_9HYPH|nr:peptidase S8 family protein [Bosea vaviloviae]